MTKRAELYDYPRDMVERRKLIRQLRRVGLQPGSDVYVPGATAELTAAKQSEIYARMVALDDELAKAIDGALGDQ